VFCPKCGTDNPPGAKFCGKCGEAMPATTPPPPPPPPPRVPGSGQQVWISIATIFIPLVGLILGIQYMSRGEPEFKKIGRLYVIMAVISIVLYTTCMIIGSFSNS
jgi:hypothetical protein